jgi:hypothetical protein
MSEKPIERLSFYNGERLKADDFKLEQDYHIRVRRWLNKSLYSAGIAHGLEVSYEPGRKDVYGRPVILVAPGLALDNEGREMIVVQQTEVPIHGRPNPPGQPVSGNYVYIQYNEEKHSEESDSLTTRSGGKLAFGGPSRVLAEPIIGWSQDFPNESRGRVVLAQVQLDNNCSVVHIYPYPRHTIGQAASTAGASYALEGERHINKDNPGRIYFHIRGRQANCVTLYLRGEKFSTLFYTEMGRHTHIIDVDVDNVIIPTHQHPLSPIKINSDPNNTDQPETGSTGLAGSHNHPLNNAEARIFANDLGGDALDHKGPGGGNESLKNRFAFTLTLNGHDGHKHALPVTTEDNEQGDPIPMTASGWSKDAGVADVAARSQEFVKVGPEVLSLKFVDDLKVYVGSVGDGGMRPLSPGDGTPGDLTRAILTQVKGSRQSLYGNKEKLGEGSGGDNDPLYSHGTGPIRLDLLSPELSFSQGEYYIDLAVDNESGGRILYNLYVD